MKLIPLFGIGWLLGVLIAGRTPTALDMLWCVVIGVVLLALGVGTTRGRK